ncbi:MAG: hydrogenase small subunit [Gammaproteobacteria bacterium]|nr:hydrogenase small subunit [Gammaproteobacteria bacterium]
MTCESHITIGEELLQRGISRRRFLKFCAATASLLALPPTMAPVIAESLAATRRRSVIWLSFQECTGCTESLTRAYHPSIEQLILGMLSLDYHHTLQAASGHAAELARTQALKASKGQTILVIDGSLPLAAGGACCTIAGMSSVDLLAQCITDASIVVAVGSCAAFGGLPMATPNPTAAVSVAKLMRTGKIPHKPLINLPGCPPVPEVMAGLFAYLLTFKRLPDLDELNRPLMFYGESVHQRCSRLHYYQQGKFAKSFDDEGARNGWCLYELGCRGLTTYNACTKLGWNGDTSNPIHSGHPCLGCSEPDFWDHDGFYSPAIIDTAAAISDGRDVYNNHCVYCHNNDPAKLRTPVDKIPELLNSDAVRAHRFNLDDEMVKTLVEYIKESRK